MTAGEPWPLGDLGEFATVDFELAVNGAPQPVAGAWVGESLLFALRERLGLEATVSGFGTA